MKRAARTLALLATLGALGGCGREASDVRSEMQALKQGLSGRVDPLPQPPARPEVTPMQVERDPFGRD